MHAVNFLTFLVFQIDSFCYDVKFVKFACECCVNFTDGFQKIDVQNSYFKGSSVWKQGIWEISESVQNKHLSSLTKFFKSSWGLLLLAVEFSVHTGSLAALTAANISHTMTLFEDILNVAFICES